VTVPRHLLFRSISRSRWASCVHTARNRYTSREASSMRPVAVRNVDRALYNLGVLDEFQSVSITVIPSGKLECLEFCVEVGGQCIVSALEPQQRLYLGL
jgi:hypothetical protein